MQEPWRSRAPMSPASRIVDPLQRIPIMVSQQPATLTCACPRLARASRQPARARSRTSSSTSAPPDAGNSQLVISVPSGSPNEVAAMRAVAEIRQHDRRLRLLRQQRRGIEPYHEPARRRRPDPPVLSALRRRGAGVRALADQPRRRPAQPALSTTSAAPSSAISPRRSPIRPICSGRARWTPADTERRAVVIGQIRRTARSPTAQRPPSRPSARAARAELTEVVT